MGKASKNQFLNIGGLEDMSEIKKLISTPLLVFIIITTVGFISIIYMGDKFWLSKIYAALDVASAVALAVLAFMIYFKYGKQLQPIAIIVEQNNEKSELPIKVLRKNFTRSELFGLLGALDKNSNFKIHYTSSIEFFKDIEDIQEGKKDTLLLKMTESDRFDF